MVNATEVKWTEWVEVTQLSGGTITCDTNLLETLTDPHLRSLAAGAAQGVLLSIYNPHERHAEATQDMHNKANVFTTNTKGY